MNNKTSEGNLKSLVLVAGVPAVVLSWLSEILSCSEAGSRVALTFLLLLEHIFT